MKTEKTLILGITATIGALILIGFTVYLATLPLSVQISKLQEDVKIDQSSLVDQSSNDQSLEEIETLQSEIGTLQDRVAKQAKLYRELIDENSKIATERDGLYDLIDRLQSNNDSLQTEIKQVAPAQPEPKKSGLQKDLERSLALASVSLYNREYGVGTADINYPNAIVANKQLMVRRSDKALGIVRVTEITPTNEAIFEPLANNFPLDTILEAGDELIAVPIGYSIVE